MNSMLIGFGAKNEACRVHDLHNYLPIGKFSDYKTIYIEPFFFTGAVFWNIPCKSAIINDINDNIYNFFYVMRNYYDHFTEEMKYVWNGIKWFEEFKERKDAVGKAIFFYLCNRMSHGGKASDKFQYKFLIKNFRKDLSEWKEKMDKMNSFSVWNLDFRVLYERIINLRGGENGRINYVIYADPPYYVQGKAYENPFEDKDHWDLLKFHNEIKDNPDFHILISYDDHEYIRKLYDGWHIKKISLKTGVSPKKSDEYHELLISNRPIEKYTQNKKLNEYFGVKNDKG